MKINPSCKGCFAGLSCIPRIKIVNLLKKKNKMNVSQIVSHFEVSQPTITYHLKYLEDVGVVKRSSQGRKVFYSISNKCKEGVCDIFK